MPSSIQDCFERQCVLITGATGFLGLALVFKIVSSTPCRRLCLLVRGGEERFWQFTQSVLPAKQYEVIASARERIIVYNGDVQKPSLGLAPRDLAEIKATVTIYIHSASSINLRRPLPSIASSVLEPSLQIADIALQSSNLEKFVYVSTAFANSHLHQLHDGIETFVSESIYPLGPRDEDSAILEYDDLHSSGTTPEYEHYNFPYPYSYAKHLTERLLIDRFSNMTNYGDRSSSILIVRPSIIGPALQEPFPAYEIRGSAPGTACLAAIMTTLSRHLVAACRFPYPEDQATIDEVPVDVVVNRILVHTARRATGVVHAVAGQAGSKTVRELFEPAMAHRQIPWGAQVAWRDVDWKDRSLHPIAQMFKVVGTAFVFEQARTEEAWACMSKQERREFPLMAPGAEAVEVDEEGGGEGEEEEDKGMQQQQQQQQPKKDGSVKGSILSRKSAEDDILMRRAGMEGVVRGYFMRIGLPSMLAGWLTWLLLPKTAWPGVIRSSLSLIVSPLRGVLSLCSPLFFGVTGYDRHEKGKKN